MSQPDKRAKLLIVDDRADVRRGLARFLGLHFDVVTASTAEEAEQLLVEGETTYVLCDYWLGRGQPLGTELIERWRDKYPFVRRIALMTGTKATAIASTEGADVIFPKPLNLNKVRDWFMD